MASTMFAMRVAPLKVCGAHNNRGSRKARSLRVRAAVADPSTSAAAPSKSDYFVNLGSELERVSKMTNLVYDTKAGLNEHGELGAQAATVSAGILLSTLSSPRSDVGALEGAMVYDKCSIDNVGGSEEARFDCVITKAYCNLAAMFSERISGCVSVEIDAHLSHNTDGIVAKARQMREMFDEMGVSTDRLLFKIPCTWQGVKAIKVLEAEGIPCHATLVFCIEQAAAAARAGATVIQVYVGRVRTWHKRNNPSSAPAAIASDPGLDLARGTAALIKAEGLDSKVMAASLRGRSDVQLLCGGCDYLLVNQRIIDDLNDAPALTRATQDVADWPAPEVGAVADEDAFEAALAASPASEELVEALNNYAATYDALKQQAATRITGLNT